MSKREEGKGSMFCYEPNRAYKELQEMFEKREVDQSKTHEEGGGNERNLQT